MKSLIKGIIKITLWIILSPVALLFYLITLIRIVGGENNGQPAESFNAFFDW